MADCYNLETAGKWLELIPGPNLLVATFRFMANPLPTRVCALEPLGMPASMRKSDPPDVRFVVTFSVTCTVSDYRDAL